jgi:predicted nicotinamide N-methyase
VPEVDDGSRKAFKERAEVRFEAVASARKPGRRCLRLVKDAQPDTPRSRRDQQHDVTGWTVWGSSVILARFLLQHRELVAGADVIELGAGCGLSGLAAAQRCAPARVELTDFNAATVDNLRANAAANAAGCAAPLSCSRMDWDDETTWPQDDDAGGPRTFSVAIGADLVYRRSYARKLVGVLQQLVSPGGVFVCATPGQRDGLHTLRQALQQAGWMCEEELDAPQEWRTNPLRAADDGSDDAFLHFPELAMKSMAYPLNVLVWRKPLLQQSASDDDAAAAGQ